MEAERKGLETARKRGGGGSGDTGYIDALYHAYNYVPAVTCEWQKVLQVTACGCGRKKEVRREREKRRSERVRCGDDYRL